MAKLPQVPCLCGALTIRVRAQTNKEDIPVGYYCPVCMQMYNRDSIPVVPINSLIDLDPQLSSYPDRAEVYRAIIKSLAVPIERDEPDPIGRAQARMIDCLTPFCREPPGAKERKDRVDREAFKTDLKKDFEKTTGIKITEEPIELGPEELEDAKL